MPRRSVRERKGRAKKDIEETGNDTSEEEFVPEKGDSDSEHEESESRIKQEQDSEVDSGRTGNGNGKGTGNNGNKNKKPRVVSKSDADSGDSAKMEQEDPDVVNAEQPLWKRKKRKKKVFVIDEKEEAKPTYTRKTEKGGYAHTNLSKSRISQANKGNKPWNFGKRRSSADKAKIAAGVRARNRTILLQKLKHLGMTEEEYLIKKKEIKYLRERVRRAKLANGKHHDKKIEQKLQEAIDATNLKNIVLGDDETKNKKKGGNKRKGGNKKDSRDHPADQDADKEETKAEEEEPKNDEHHEHPHPHENENENPHENQQPQPHPHPHQDEKQNDRATGIFSTEIAWRPFSFGEKKNDDDDDDDDDDDAASESYSYDRSCPEGGPGGLICCERCSTNYHLFLTRTSEDMETYRMNKEAGEVTEILEFLNQKKQILKDAVNNAKTKIPPLPPPGSGRIGLRLDSVQGGSATTRSNNGNRRNSTRMETTEVHTAAWNLTSSIDLGFTGGFASV
mmetsp:Transcript_12098/g.34661  ORF Transcript_12098/g.34661 Transcript_12098/m.34661 type:complete len:507 (-) Transcript_12098:109-1629(-)